MFLVVILYAVFASSFWLTKECLVYSSPMFITFFRGIVSGLFLLAWYVLGKKDKFKLTNKDWFILLFGSFCFSFIPNNFSGIALQHISSVKAALYYALAPFITAFIAYMYLDEKMTIKKWIGLLIGFTGLIPIICFETSKEGLSSILSFSVYDLLIIIAVFFYAVGWIIIKPLVSKEEHSPYLLNGLIMLFGGLLALATSFFSPMQVPEKMNLFLPWGVALTLANNIFSYTLYMYLLKFYSPVFISFAGFSEYIFAIFYAWLFVGESVGYSVLVSAILISLGLFLFYQEELREEKLGLND